MSGCKCSLHCTTVLIISETDRPKVGAAWLFGRSFTKAYSILYIYYINCIIMYVNFYSYCSEMYDNFDPFSVCLYLKKHTNTQYEIQCELYRTLVAGGDYKYILHLFLCIYFTKNLFLLVSLPSGV